MVRGAQGQPQAPDPQRVSLEEPGAPLLGLCLQLLVGSQPRQVFRTQEVLRAGQAVLLARHRPHQGV